FHPVRSEVSLYLQHLTRFLNFSTFSDPFFFQSLPTIKFSKSGFLITIRIAGGWGGAHPVGVSPMSCRLLTRVSPLECAVTSLLATVHSKGLMLNVNSFRMRSYAKTRGGGVVMVN